jgi:hypothetical protein
MGPTTALRRALKERFIPFMIEKGFALDQRHAPQFIDFRRVVGDRVQFFEIQWEKYGRPRFTVNFGSASTNGTISHNQHIDANDIGPGQAVEYCRIHPNGNGSSTRHWFRQDRPFVAALFAGSWLYPPEQIVQQLMDLFAEAEIYWSTGTVGKYSKVIKNSWASDN